MYSSQNLLRWVKDDNSGEWLAASVPVLDHYQPSDQKQPDD
jgi:hypothetical protein